MEEWRKLTAYEETPFDDDFEENVLDNPRKIYEYLRSKVYKQDKACKAAAMILYNHIHGKITSRNFFCGPAGVGKTYIWQIVKQNLYPYIIIADASTITKTGWVGSNKISSPLYQINPDVNEGYIIVYDEFDKLCKPQHSHGENVSASIQSELLTLIQPSTDYIRLKDAKDTERVVNISNITWVFCGSFAEAAEKEAKKGYSSGLGFGSVKNEPKAFEQELTMKNLIDFGVIPEVASRATRLVNLRPLTEEDYTFLLMKHPNSPVKRLEDIYGFDSGFIRGKIIKRKELQEIALNAYESGLGVRSTTSAIQRRVDDYLFDHFETMS